MNLPIEPIRTPLAAPVEPAERALRERDPRERRDDPRDEHAERREPTAEAEAVAHDGHIDVRA